MLARMIDLRHKLPGLGMCLAALLACGTILLLSITSTAGAASSDSGTPPTIAVVDLSGIFRTTEEWKDYQATHQKSLEKMERVLSKLERNLRVLRSEYQNLAPGTDARKSKRKELEEGLKEFQKEKSNFQQQISKDYNDFLQKMFRKVTGAVEKYARENGIDMVLKKTNLKQSPTSPSQTDLMIATTNVLYAGKQIDITDQVAEKLNSEYPGQIEVK